MLSNRARIHHCCSRQRICGDGTNLYVGGQFQTAGGVAANSIARWNGTNWSSLGEGAENGVQGSVYALAVRKGRVYAGGYFRTAGSVPAAGLAMWSGTKWCVLGSGIDFPGRDGITRVNALALDKRSLYVGGVFLRAGNKCSASIARWIDEPELTLLPPTPAYDGSFLYPLNGALGLRFVFEFSNDLRDWTYDPFRFSFGLGDQVTLRHRSTMPQNFCRGRLMP